MEGGEGVSRDGERPYWTTMEGGMEAYHEFLRAHLAAELGGDDGEDDGGQSFWSGVRAFFKRTKYKRRKGRGKADLLELNPEIIRSLEGHFQFLKTLSRTSGGASLSPEQVQAMQASFEERLAVADAFPSPPTSAHRLNYLLENGREMPSRASESERGGKASGRRRWEHCDCSFQALPEGALRLKSPLRCPRGALGRDLCQEGGARARSSPFVILEDYITGGKAPSPGVQILRSPGGGEQSPGGLSPCSLDEDNPLLSPEGRGLRSFWQRPGVAKTAQSPKYFSPMLSSAASGDSPASSFTSPQSFPYAPLHYTQSVAASSSSSEAGSCTKSRQEEPSPEQQSSSRDSLTTNFACSGISYRRLETPYVSQLESALGSSTKAALVHKFVLCSSGGPAMSQGKSFSGGDSEAGAMTAEDTKENKTAAVTKRSPDSVLEEWDSPALLVNLETTTSDADKGKSADEPLLETPVPEFDEAMRKFSESYFSHKNQVLLTLLKQSDCPSLGLDGGTVLFATPKAPAAGLPRPTTNGEWMEEFRPAAMTVGEFAGLSTTPRRERVVDEGLPVSIPASGSAQKIL
ncbi:hypothetical protein HOP50_04g33030 [Chloropicon primus]|uniref:Uncharacterized protein n=1 Tax=Chloropicon primus TaxID=1764295 RepID=A0A5B8MKJ0_9CHLO|nr:hypothetical protein A3770_04p32990 [Chloropicon primus]UPQ99993.1 hypothetical protein HOP50_04g33030 [Chloropicon primus]|eukprot:QDZ20781.1 hypothetical protein A3770_04p32990 [Chloropicon primus]